MYNSKSAGICLALFLALVKIGSCLQCYHCTSQEDPNCAKNLSSVKVLDCASPTNDSILYNQKHVYNILPNDVFGGTDDSGQKYCHTIVMETGLVIRTCLDGNAADVNQTCKTMQEETKAATKDKKVVSCVPCKEDKCNGGDADVPPNSDASDVTPTSDNPTSASPNPANEAGTLSVSLHLSALILFITYLLHK